MPYPDTSPEYIEFSFSIPPEVFDPVLAELQKGTRKSELLELLVDGLGYSVHAAESVIKTCDSARKRAKRLQCLVGLVIGAVVVGLFLLIRAALNAWWNPEWPGGTAIAYALIVSGFCGCLLAVTSVARMAITVGSLDLPLIRAYRWNQARRQRNRDRRERFNQANL